ncbi:M20/M25/M40 family metallo-hydrolase [Roseimaritima sediminicola]|uniref:M20/M25/M40 family metallo-hydrolase n=1 Tax=Roseimaritima sediminicola TaxID=2662066 RepID=UPI001298271D|nr:M20/M25/M40 family metallo-hydrolase [Roseimaritima sediminicola]
MVLLRTLLFRLPLVLASLGFAASAVCSALAQQPAAPTTPAAAAHGDEESTPPSKDRETLLLENTRQLTFEGRRSGEGYFNPDASQMVFQSERQPGNPFYQIYLMDMATADITRVSPGTGRTTCAWLHPVDGRVLFASTHEDPQAEAKQKQRLELRQSGNEPRYSWSYDPEYELYAKDLDDGRLTRLTHERGYDAEGSYSPDGTKIAFASNRQAYERELTQREAALFEHDPASMMEIYIMDADGSNVQRLTDSLGYDGGPFFSPDGQRICWRRFSEDGATAEIYTMRIDGSDQQRLTRLDAMSWAPFYHPSGDYLVFTTNLHGFGNFELYLVRADGQGKPVRVTETEGADLLPVFLPDGKQLSWTSTRTDSGRSQIFLADWNDAAARELLGLDSPDRSAALASAQATSAGFTPADIGRHVDYLTRPELAGRLTGTEGERRATAYVAAYLESLGFEPAGENGSWYQTFEFPAGSERTDNNHFATGTTVHEQDQQWRPLAFSGTGDFDPAELVFAGYGMQVPASDQYEQYDSYVHLDVAGKWVVVLRDLPQDITPERRQQMARYSDPRRKAQVARDLGARGLIFVTGPTSKVRNQLLRFDRNASAGSISIAVLSVTDAVARKWFEAAGKDLGQLQKSLDSGEMQMGFPLTPAAPDQPPLKVSATIDILRKRGTGRNVLGRLPAADQPTEEMVIVGAHIDHLGRGAGSNSLASEDEQGQIHYGADDNASGVAAMLEIAQNLAAEVRSGRLKPRRDLVVAGWSGEELGLFGSQAFVEDFSQLFPHAAMVSPAGARDAVHPHAAAAGQPTPPGSAKHKPAAQDGDAGTATPAPSHHGAPSAPESLAPTVAAYLNLDMVGRLREKLVVQGIGSSPQWAGEVQRRNVPVGLKLELDKTSTRLPTDAASFVSRGVPVLAFFTGAHEDYHTPRDTAEKLNYEGAAKVAHLTALISRGLLTAEAAPVFELAEGEAAEDAPRVRLTAFLGTIPDYASGDVKGQVLSGVSRRGPAEQAGLRAGDRIIELAGRKIEDIYDYTYAIEALKIGEPVKVVIVRDDKEMTLTVTPGSRN